jgi:uncharacterized membrane protein (DUF441 family)
VSSGLSEGYLQRRPHFVPALLAAAMLVVALAKLPYGYYTALRWVTCAVAVYVTFLGVAGEQIWAAWPFALIALLFNPVLPVHLTRGIWRPLDIAAAALFVASAFVIRSLPERTHEA